MINILLADDHQIVLTGLCNLLNLEIDINIAGAASNGYDVIKLLKQGIKPDILITDLYIPGINGLELTQLLAEQYPDIKVIILTMETNEKYLIDAFKLGVKSYLLKQITHTEILFAIRQVYQGKCFICTETASSITKWLGSYFSPRSTECLDMEFSKRELEILHLLADGYTNIEIADKLYTSRRTVEGHRQSLINKTGVRNTPELIKFAMLNKLLKIDHTGAAFNNSLSPNLPISTQMMDK